MIKKTLYLIYLLPIVLLILLSFSESWRFPSILPHTWTFLHWKRFLDSSGNLQEGVCLSLFLSLSVALISTTLGFMLSKHIKQHQKSDILLRLAYFPYSFSPVIYAFCVHFLFLNLGLNANFVGVWLAQFLLVFPFTILIFSSHWTIQIFDIETLAKTLGCTSWQIFWQVLYPISKKILQLAFFQSFLVSWFDYGIVSIIGFGKIQTLNIITYQYINEANIYLAAVASLFTLSVPLLLLWLNFKFTGFYSKLLT